MLLTTFLQESVQMEHAIRKIITGKIDEAVEKGIILAHKARVPKAVEPLRSVESHHGHCARCSKSAGLDVSCVRDSAGVVYCRECYNRGNCAVCAKALTLVDVRFRVKDTGKLYCAGCVKA